MAFFETHAKVEPRDEGGIGKREIGDERSVKGWGPEERSRGNHFGEDCPIELLQLYTTGNSGKAALLLAALYFLEEVTFGGGEKKTLGETRRRHYRGERISVDRECQAIKAGDASDITENQTEEYGTSGKKSPEKREKQSGSGTLSSMVTGWAGGVFFPI